MKGKVKKKASKKQEQKRKPGSKSVFQDDWPDEISVDALKYRAREFKCSNDDYEVLIDEKQYNKQGENIPTVDDALNISLKSLKTIFPKDCIPFYSIKLWKRYQRADDKLYHDVMASVIRENLRQTVADRMHVPTTQKMIETVTASVAIVITVLTIVIRDKKTHFHQKATV